MMKKTPKNCALYMLSKSKDLIPLHPEHLKWISLVLQNVHQIILLSNHYHRDKGRNSLGFKTLASISMHAVSDFILSTFLSFPESWL